MTIVIIASVILEVKPSTLHKIIIQCTGLHFSINSRDRQGDSKFNLVADDAYYPFPDWYIGDHSSRYVDPSLPFTL